MKLQARFALLLALVFIAIGSLLIVQRSFDLERSQQVLTSELNQRKSLFEATVTAEGKTFQTFSEDYSFWDEMVSFVQTGDQDFAATNLDSGLKTFGADAAWVFRPDGSLLYTATADGPAKKSSIKFNAAYFQQLRTSKFGHFYVMDNGQIMEIRAATIVPGSDPKHTTTPQGFWLIGRYLDNDYVTSLSTASQSKVTIAGSNIGDEIKGSVASFSLPLEDWQGQTIASVRSTIQVSLIDDLNALYQRELGLLFLVSIIMVGLISVAIYLLILRPIRKITDAIRQQRPDELKPVAEAGGQLGNLAQVVQQFFQQKVVIEAEQTKQANLEKLNKDKTAFLAVAAHELKSPISIIKLLAEDLPKQLANMQPDGLSKQLDIITHQATKMATLINDLRLAGEGREATVYNQTVFDLDSFLAKEVTEMGFIINQRLVQEGTTGVSVNADIDRLAQVVSNLIRNAAKYSPHADRVIVRSSVDNGRAVIEFQDFGVGISPEDQAHIFERFYRAPSVTSTFQGLGLGLSISQNIIEHFDGKIWLKSQPGEGSSFFISLPVYKGGLQIPQQVAKPQDL